MLKQTQLLLSICNATYRGYTVPFITIVGAHLVVVSQTFPKNLNLSQPNGFPNPLCWNTDPFPTVDGSEILRSPVEVGSVSHDLQGFSTIPGGARQISEPSSQ